MVSLFKTANVKKSKMTKKNMDYIFVVFMLLIPVIHFIIFWGVVNFNSILLAFQRLDTETGELYFTLENFETVFNFMQERELRVALTNTLLTWGFQTIFLMPWSFFITYFLYKKIPLTGVWRLFLFLPSILPAIFLTSMFKYAIQPIGPIGKLWSLLFDREAPTFLLEVDYAKWIVLLYFFWTNFGGQFILLMGAMARIPTQLLEAGQIDGVNMWVEMFQIVFPLCWSTFSMILVLNVASLFTASGPILLLTQGGADTETISYWIFRHVQGGDATLFMPSALGVVCTLIIFPIVTFVRWGSGKIWADVEF